MQCDLVVIADVVTFNCYASAVLLVSLDVEHPAPPV